MIFGYNEIKGYVTEDFERFYKMNFNERQMFPAVLDEYQFHDDFTMVENICIHVVLALNYIRQEWNCADIIKKLKLLMNDETENELKLDLGNEYSDFYADYSTIMKKSSV